MPPDNVEIVRASMDAFSRADLDAALAPFDPDVVWEVDPVVVPDAGTYHGHEGVLEFWEQWHELFRGFELLIEEAAEIDADHVLVRARGHGAGAVSGAEVDSPPFWQLTELREGRVVRVAMHASRSAALRDAGLPE